MKKMLAILSTIILINSLQATVDWNNMQDVGYVAGAAAVGIFGAGIASYYLHPAAARRAEIEATQEDKRMKAQKEEAEQLRQEQAEKERINASITLAKLLQDYALETKELENHKELTRERLTEIVRSKQSAYLSRFEDYYKALNSTIHSLHTIGVLLSPEEKKSQLELLTKLQTVKHIFNKKLNEEINAEQEEAKRIRRHEEAEQRKIEREQLEIKKLRGDVEAQQTIKKTNDSVNLVLQRLDAIEQRQISAQKNNNLESASFRRQIAELSEVIKDSVSTARAQLATFILQQIDKAKEVVVKAQQVSQSQQPTVVVNQVPPPYNPAAVSALSGAPSEAVDGAMTVPPATYR